MHTYINVLSIYILFTIIVNVLDVAMMRFSMMTEKTYFGVLICHDFHRVFCLSHKN